MIINNCLEIKKPLKEQHKQVVVKKPISKIVKKETITGDSSSNEEPINSNSKLTQSHSKPTQQVFGDSSSEDEQEEKSPPIKEIIKKKTVIKSDSSNEDKSPKAEIKHDKVMPASKITTNPSSDEEENKHEKPDIRSKKNEKDVKGSWSKEKEMIDKN